MIDWSKLEDYDNSKYRSFEELCYQIAKRLYGNKGEFTSIDDSGGGDGVEFYLTLPNGDEWGWQAKFFHPNSRLNHGNRKKQIEKSLKKACEKHPKLKKWFLCTPTEFTVEDGRGRNRRGISEKTWFETKLFEAIPKDFEDLKLIHWGESDFNNWLSQPQFIGKKNYFFGELELSMGWFIEKCKKFIAPVPNKFQFESVLHTETHIDEDIHEFLIDDEFLLILNKRITEIGMDFDAFINSLNELRDNLPDQIEWDSFKPKIIEKAKNIEKSLNEINGALKDANTFLKSHEIEKAQQINFKELYDNAMLSFRAYEKIKFENDIVNIKYTGKINKKEKIINKSKEIIDEPLNSSLKMLNTFHLLIYSWDSINSAELHIFGEAGIGKTHVVSFNCQKRLKNEKPALIVSGRNFTSNLPIEEQMRIILGIPSSYGWVEFLDALEAVAEAYHVRIPIIIDGLNEATYNNAFSDIWRNYLFSFIEEIKQRENITLITTCRKSYQKPIWGDMTPKNATYAQEFDSRNTEIAINKYFKFYKIHADLTAAPITQFSNPLYLRIFCEVINPEKNEEIEITISQKSIFEVFDEYMLRSNRLICDRLDLDYRANIISSSLNKMAEYLWKKSKRGVSLEKLVEIVDNKPLEDLRKSESKVFKIEDEGLLIYRDMGNEEENLYFTYDLFGGYIIARYLIEQEINDLNKFVNSEKTILALFSDDYSNLHPLYSDIRRCLAALIPVKMKRFLHDFSDNELVIVTSIQSLFEISPDEINENCIKFVKNQFKDVRKRNLLFDLFKFTLTNTEHPFNSMFLSNLLKELALNDRDISWSEYVRENIEYLKNDLDIFEEICKTYDSFSEEVNARIKLFANYILWFLTSTVHGFRDSATRALYWYGRTFPKDFFELVEKSFEINDPYISERMVAAAYGVCMDRQYDFEDNTFSEEILPIYGRKLYDLMFKENASYSTTHILKRDYAMRMIQIALIHYPSLLTNKEIERIQPPFKDGGIREWKESEDKDEGKYRDGNYPLDGIAHDDLVSFLGRGMDKYKRPPEYKKAEANLWWRIYDLGYSLDIFGDIDKKIAYYGSRGLKEVTDIYGRKYAKIATFELAGYRDDLGLLKDEWNNEYQRMSFVDIDPSFPDEIGHYNLVKDDFLGDRTLSIKDWILKDDIPDLKKYLVLNEINGEKGPWVLLDGYINQENSDFNRNRYIFPRGILVKSENEVKLLEKLKKQDLFGRWLPEVPEEHYVFFGEIAWCDTFLENEFTELSFEIGTKIVTSIEKRHRLLRNGKLISKDEEKKFWNSIPNVKLMFVGHRMIKFSLVGVDAEKTIKNELKKQKLELRIEDTEIKNKITEHEKMEILIPVMENNWEDQRSPIISGRNVAVLNKQIMEYLNLCNQPQTFNFYEKNGKIASIVFSYSEDWHSKQNFIYLRQDLLDSFLSNHDYKLIWAIWGAKEFYSEDNDELFKFREKNQDQNPFQEIIAYSDLKNQNQILSKKSNSKLIKGQ